MTPDDDTSLESDGLPEDFDPTDFMGSSAKSSPEPIIPETFEQQVEAAHKAQMMQAPEPEPVAIQSTPAAAASAAVAQFQRVQATAAVAFRPLTNTVWSKLDRKATAVTEFTLRQYRTKNSTWVVLGIGVVFVAMVLMFYGEAMATGFESVDNDGDSADWDGDGYPTGQEFMYDTDPWDENSHPDPNIIPPDPAEKWIDEDGIDWDNDYTNWNQGYDDDGDCTGEGWVNQNSFSLPSNQDSNGDRVNCNVHYTMNSTTKIIYRINADTNVDEDPNDEEFLKESLHRAFVLGFGKIGFGFLIGIFLPLFLATGLVRDEMENGTLHYLMGKPIARAEILAYRLLGYISLVWPYSTALILLTAIITGFLAPSESIFRFHDLSAWLGVLLASWLVMLAYGTVFCTLGVISPKYGIWIAIGLGVWEFAMAMISLGAPTFPLTWMSISHWGIEIINCTSSLAYPDQSYLINIAGMNGDWGSEAALSGFYSPPSVVANSPFISLLISVLILIIITVGALFIGQSSLKQKELN
ncbi:MAG: ABC transporter permease [Euryarchaeota archaeon]|jgi:ABC-type transport system involved in multi-copper enzyme maturation permease subunit|nr:ABC transporter permease [Euryarchaeota archaeon]